MAEPTLGFLRLPPHPYCCSIEGRRRALAPWVKVLGRRWLQIVGIRAPRAGLGPLVYRDGVTPPLNPGRPPERAGESTRAPLISPEKLALPRPARGAPLASSLAGLSRETGGQWGPHPRTSPCAHTKGEIMLVICGAEPGEGMGGARAEDRPGIGPALG